MPESNILTFSLKNPSDKLFNEISTEETREENTQPLPETESVLDSEQPSAPEIDLFDPTLPEGSFDAVMAFNVLLYVDNFEEVMVRIQKLLKPGGVFLSATDCLGWNFSKSARMKFWRSRTGKMPYVGFFSQKGLIKKIEQGGFTVLETENLFPSPPNLFVAAKKK